MKLSGRFEDFELSKFLQFLSLDKATGVLELRRGEERIAIALKGGELYDVDHSADSKSNRIGQILLEGERISPQEYSMAREEGKRGRVPVEQRYINYGSLSSEETIDLKTLVFGDILAEALTWDDCYYSFKANAVGAGNGSVKPLTMEHFLLDVFRQRDSWGFVRQSVPVNEVVFRPVLTDKTREQWRKLFTKSNERDRNVFRLVNGRYNVQNIAHRALRSVFDVSRILWHLERSGMVERVRVPVGENLNPWPAGFFEMQYDMRVFSICAALGAVLFLVFFMFHAYFLPNGFTPTPESPVSNSASTR